MKRRFWSLLSVLLVVAFVVTACGGSEAVQPTPAPGGVAVEPTVEAGVPAVETPMEEPTQAEPTEAAVAPMATEAMTGTAEAAATPLATTGAMTTTAALRDPQEAALEAAGGQQIGGSVTVLGTWGGSEQDSFMAMVQPFMDATGVEVQYTGTRDLNAVLTTRVAGGDPPDLAGLPGPGQMAEFAQQDKLIDLSTVLDLDQYNQNYSSTWVDLGTVDGKLVGVFIKAAAKGLIWYNPKVWQQNGWEIPQTWDEMMQLSQTMAETGTTPWCVGLESGASSGWPGTDWLEDIVLRQSGPDVYRQWYQGEAKWTSDQIRQAWETWGEIVADPNMVYGGSATMLTLAFGSAADPLFTDPPGCFMHHQASFMSDFIKTNNPDLQPIQDYDFFPFPSFEGQGGQLEVAGDLFGMFNDTPQAQALMKYLVTPEAQAIWVERGGAISPNQQVPLETYPDELSRKSADLLTGAESVAFDASDLMPEAMNNAFWQAILQYVQAPDGLDGILQNLDSVQQDAYRQ